MPKNDDILDDLFFKFKDLADKKHEIFDEDLINIASNIKVTENLINLGWCSVGALGQGRRRWRRRKNLSTATKSHPPRTQAQHIP